VPSLVKAALHNKDRDTRSEPQDILDDNGQLAAAACSALEASDLSKHAAWAVPPLVKAALQHKHVIIMNRAKNILSKLDEHAATPALPLLGAALQDDDPAVCMQAIELLGDLCKHAASAVPLLVEAASQHKTASIRRMALDHLDELGKRAAARAIELLGDLDKHANACTWKCTARRDRLHKLGGSHSSPQTW
jgi:hypothetical protein